MGTGCVGGTTKPLLGQGMTGMSFPFAEGEVKAWTGYRAQRSICSTFFSTWPSEPSTSEPKSEHTAIQPDKSTRLEIRNLEV